MFNSCAVPLVFLVFSTFTVPPAGLTPMSPPPRVYSSWEEFMIAGSQAQEMAQDQEAERLYLKALDATAGNIDRQITTLEELDSLYLQTDNQAGANKIAQRLLSIFESLPKPPKTAMANLYLQLASSNYALQRLDQVEICAAKAVSLFKSSNEPISANVGIALNNLGWAEYRLHKLGPAQNHFRQSLAILESTLGRHSIFYAMTAANLATVYQAQGKKASARFWFERADRAFESALGKNARMAGEIIKNYRDLTAPHNAPAHQNAKPQNETQYNRHF